MKAVVFTYFRSIIDRFFEEFSNRCFIDERTSQNAEYIEQAAVEMAVKFGDSNKAVSTYGAIDLYSDRIFRVAPKGFDIQMLLDPFEEQLNLPALLIKHCNIFCADIKRIGDVCKRAFEFFGIVLAP